MQWGSDILLLSLATKFNNDYALFSNGQNRSIFYPSLGSHVRVGAQMQDTMYFLCRVGTVTNRS